MGSFMINFAWAHDLTASDEICRGTICGLGAIGLHFLGSISAAAIAAGSAILLIHGLWRAALRCHRLVAAHGWRAIFNDDDYDHDGSHN
jgi:hypothetical protein